MTLRIVLARAVAACLRTFAPGTPALWRLRAWGIRNVRMCGGAMGSPTIKTHFGFRLRVHLHDWVDQHLYATGSYEDMTAKTIATLLAPGDVCIDGGANIGFFTLLMAQCVGRRGTVWAFEPSPDTRARLLHNIALNRASNVTVRPEALADVDGVRLFFSGSTDHSGIASFRAVRASNASYEVRTRRLTDCLPASTWVSLIKLDIEGAEHLALEGMADLLRTQRPDIVLELSDHFLNEMGSSSAAVYQLLASLGYHMHVIEWDGLSPRKVPDDSLPAQFNALFTVRESIPAQLLRPRV